MPVLPEVGSISVSPGRISPRDSAPRIIQIAGRSFTEPAGLLPSSLARMLLFDFRLSSPGRRCRRASGVSPMKSSTVLFIFSEAALQQLAHIVGDALRHRPERALVAGLAQAGEVGLGVALVFPDQRL